MSENMKEETEFEVIIEEETPVEKPPQPKAAVSGRPGVKTGRPDLLTLTAVYHFVLAIPGLLIALIILAVPVPVVIATVRDSVALTWSLIGLGLGFMFFFIPGLVLLLTGIGLLKGWNWTRWLGVALAILGLLAFPLGTIIGAFIIFYLLNDEARLFFEK